MRTLRFTTAIPISPEPTANDLHHRPRRYLILAFFDSYESAMENSNLPEKSQFSEKQAALLDGPMAFQDFAVIEDRS
jgi:hypothetical protein